MKMATVVGVLQTDRTAAGYESVRWVQLRTEEGMEVALDPVGAKAGDCVVYAGGSVAQLYRMEGSADAVILAVVTGEK